MLDAFGIGLGGFYWHSYRAKNVDNEPMTSADFCASASPFSVKNTPRYGRAVANPVRFKRETVLIAVAWETPSRRAMSVGRASPSLASRSAINST